MEPVTTKVTATMDEFARNSSEVDYGVVGLRDDLRRLWRISEPMRHALKTGYDIIMWNDWVKSASVLLVRILYNERH